MTTAHAVALTRLPLHHQNPFDRLLIAQSICEPLRLLKAYAVLGRYSEVVIVI